MPRSRTPARLAALLLGLGATSNLACVPVVLGEPRSANGRLLAGELALVAAHEPAPDRSDRADEASGRHSESGVRRTGGTLRLDPLHAASWLTRSTIADRIRGIPTPPDPSARELLEIEGVGTYLPENLAANRSLVTRWADRDRQPLRVWIGASADAAPGGNANRSALVVDAFTAWHEAGVPLRVNLLADSAQAEVHVHWVSAFERPISGRTRWTHDREGWIHRGDITLALNHLDGTPLDPRALKAIAMHEIGHLLGLDHTVDEASIMAPRVRVRELAAVDRASARLLYRLPAGLLR